MSSIPRTAPVADEHEQIARAITALEAQRALLGEAVVEMAVAPLRARLATLPAAAEPARQQLKQVSVVFVDTVGSTAMAGRLDPEAVHAVLDGALEGFTATVRRHRGRVLQYTGDGLLAAFGADETHEDDAENAVRAALAIVDGAARHAAVVRERDGFDGYGVRVGIATGPVLLGGGIEAEGSIRGSTVNLASRLEQSAPTGGVRIHHDTFVQVRGVFDVLEQPPLVVKGIEAPLVTYVVTGIKPRAARAARRGIDGVETRMVAREAELAQLQEVFGAFTGRPRLSLVSIVGEAGLGKSRLLAEFERWAEARPARLCWLRARAEPQTQQQPFGLLRDLLAWALRIADDDDAATARRKLTEGIAPLFEADGESQAHLLGQLVGFDFADSPHVQGIGDDARQLRNRGFHAGVQWLRRLAARQQTAPLIVLDDLHWADDGTLDFLHHLVQAPHDEPALMICLTRQTLFERRADWALLAAAHTRIELEPLNRDASRELADALLQRVHQPPDALRALVLGGAEGNPFYMEELVRMLIDDGAISTAGERWRVVPERLLAAHVPPTLTGVLQARLDSLPAAEKRALQQAAVIGFVFWEHALTQLDAPAVRVLPQLQQRVLIVGREQAVFEGQTEYAFKHQILYQVTYDSVLRRERREQHALVAAWLAQVGAERGAETLALAADHYERAGDTANACAYLTRAAEDAAARYANEAMLGFVGRALALAPPDDAHTRWRLLWVRERYLLAHGDRAAHAADLQALAALAETLADDDRRALVALRRAAALLDAGEFAAAEAEAQRGLALAQPTAGARHAAALLHLQANALIRRGRYPQARAVAEQGLALARSRADHAEESKLINALGLIAMEQGDLMEAAQHFEHGLVMVRALGNRADEGVRLSNLGSLSARLGSYARARRYLEEGLQLARAIGETATEAALLLNIASVAHLQGDDADALNFAKASLASATASDQRDLAAFARMVAGHAELSLARHDAARSAYAEARAGLEALHMPHETVLDPVSGLARVALAEGRVADALACIAPLLEHAAAGGHFDGTEEPLLLPLTCWQVLHAAGDARAGTVLADAVAELQTQAGRISDAGARRGFLEDVPHHRELMRAWRGQAQDRSL